jgi:Putative restriction endonuclease
VVWEEGGRYPDVLFEFLSPSTRRADRTPKKELYERVFRTREYYWYDPFDPRELQGWHLDAEGSYQAVTPDERGWLWSPALQLWIGRWEGTYKCDQTIWLRLYDQPGRLALTSDEAAEQQAEAERTRAEAERTRAKAEQARAEAERTRADTAEAEVARLRAELARLRGETQ